MKHRKIPRSKFQEGIELCKKNILNFLQSARGIINEGRLNHAYVNVQFAVEELGKIIMLKEALRKSTHDPILVNEEVFTNHKGKSEKAWTFLDPKFKTIYKGGFSEENFAFIGFETNTKARHETRLNCAFVDFDESSCNWHVGRDIDESLLINMINHIESKIGKV